MKLSQNAKEWIIDIVIAIAIASLILCFIKPTIVKEHSMENTLHDGDYLFVSRQSYKLFGHEPQRGDIIVFESQLTTVSGRDKLLIKRVIGLPGDKVSIQSGYVFINGQPIPEGYTKDGYTASDMPEITVPTGQLFCLGDNRQNSTDSRDARVGCVPMDAIMGKAVFRLFPLSGIGRI